MSDFYRLGLSCNNCGKPLEARLTPETGICTIEGLRSLEYRHADGTTECVIVKSPRPYDGWSASAAFDAARRDAWDAHDRELTQQEPSDV